jgi:hypothetical protein
MFQCKLQSPPSGQMRQKGEMLWHMGLTMEITAEVWKLLPPTGKGQRKSGDTRIYSLSPNVRRNKKKLVKCSLNSFPQNRFVNALVTFHWIAPRCTPLTLNFLVRLMNWAISCFHLIHPEHDDCHVHWMTEAALTQGAVDLTLNVCRFRSDI